MRQVHIRRCFCVSAGLLAIVAARPAWAADHWYKGNTHTHTWWSDGDSPPEVAVKYYKEHGYNFLVLSDHNILSEGERWVTAEKKREVGLKKYQEEFPTESIEKRERNGVTEYRLKTLKELRAAFAKPDAFILVQGEEISDKFGKLPIHLNGFNLKQVVPPQGGKSVADTLQRNINAVLAQRKATGQPMFPHINHPNFGWGLTAEDMVGLRGEQFFEVFNCHRGVNNYGDEARPSTERIWDIVLSRRLGELNLPVMYGMASDDAHNHVKMDSSSNPGRGWVMVRAEKLTPAALVAAMEKGDFYASTGVTLRRIEFKNNTLRIEIEPKPGVTYRTQFIGTPRDYDKAVTTRPAPDGQVAYEYSKDIGKVFAEVAGETPSHKLTGNELYVRAKIISSALHPNPYAKGDTENAWTQPVVGK
jgi:hypothetical protein